VKRMYQHRNDMGSSFTLKYKVFKLVYYEIFNDINDAIKREKQIKGGSRKKKIELIQFMNPDFRDLYDDIIS
ncbi:MAG: excinuclease ABC subunit C, partial [Candidatus Levybacteria bacterium RIFCSPLOWO2_02_FULL_37_18]